MYYIALATCMIPKGRWLCAPMLDRIRESLPGVIIENFGWTAPLSAMKWSTAGSSWSRIHDFVVAPSSDFAQLKRLGAGAEGGGGRPTAEGKLRLFQKDGSRSVGAKSFGHFYRRECPGQQKGRSA